MDASASGGGPEGQGAPGAPAPRPPHGPRLSAEDCSARTPGLPPVAPAAPSQSLADGAPPSLRAPHPGAPLSPRAPHPGPTGTFSDTVIFSPAPGPAPSREVDACASTAFSGIMGHTNAISDERSSNGGTPSTRRSDGAGPSAAEAPLPSARGDPRPHRVVCQTKTVHRPLHYDIPCPEAPPAGPSRRAEGPATPCLSSAGPGRRPTGWAAPPGAGLRGGAPGETSAISNGTTGWGPPPSGQGSVSSNQGGWGNAPAAQQSAASAWGAPQEGAGQGRAGPGPGAPGGPAPDSQPGHYNLPAFASEEAANNSKMLNSHPPMAQPQAGPAAGHQPAPGPGAPQPNTSWAAAAGKGLPPSEPATSATNGSTNKQLEQLNSVREALFSQDGWGGQNVKQDTSWDVGAPAAEPLPAAAAVPARTDSMQWQAPSQGRNDGTDLWKSTLSGVPQQPKPVAQQPWGNHTPTNPADYKNWGEEDGGGGGGGMQSQDQDPSPMWNPRDVGMSAPPGGAVGPGPGPPWEQQERPMGPGRFDDRGPRTDWGGAPKSKEDAMWGPSGPGQYGGGGPDGPRGRGAEPTNWGPPPPGKPGAGGSWGGPGAQPPMQRAPQWEDNSPTMGRRGAFGAEDDGTSIWGQKEPNRGPAPPGGWKDMPIPSNLGPRPGPRLPGGAGPMGKEGQASPWGPPQPGGGRYGEEMGGGGAMWAGKEEPRWSGEGDGWSAGGRQKPGPMRSSPSWEEPSMGGGDRWGPRGGPGGGSKDMVWGSKQFRILREMGFREADVETALRQTNMQLEDALEMLNTLGAGRGGMPGRGMPPTDVFGPRGEPDFGPRGFPNPGPMPPYGPGGEIPPSNPGMVAPSLSNPNRNMNPNMMINGVQPHAPPRPQQNGPPSTSQLRVLVQQIQMAVQAGHLNPQILNQPLAPQTLLLLNQLLQQIKQLQNYQQQHAMAQAAGQRPGAPSSQALLGLTVQITKHKQQIQNLQNQITAQQAQYLKQQAQPQQGGGQGQGPEDILPGLGNMAIDQPKGSKFLELIGNKSGEEFPKAPGAPGSGRAPNSQSSPNLLLENNGPWSNAHGADAGWPSAPGDKPMNTSAEEVDNFGIPEFVPGKAWKGTALKDPSEDPTLTPGSVTSLPAAVTTAENSLGLTSSTWSFNTNNSKDSPAGGPKEPWGNPGPGLPPSSSATNLTAMGQDLWGQSRTSTAPGKAGPAPAGSGWPASNGGLSTASGWSNGTNGQSNTTMTPTTMVPGQPQGQGSSWLLLKNLTTQIDGSTLQTLCKQHGPLLNFHLYLPHGIALVKYSNGQEAKKAQNALNNCVLGNTTILAETTGEHEVELIMRTISSGGQSAGQPPVSHRGSTPGTAFGSTGGGYNTGLNSLAKSSSGDTWSALGGGVSLGWPSTSSSSSSSGLGGGVWGAPDGDQHNRTTPLNSFLPNDLLAEGM